LERYCSSVFDPNDLICGSASELRQNNEICKPSDFSLYHLEQPGRPPMATEDPKIAWAWGWSLIRRCAVLVPACLVYMPYFPCFRHQGEEVAGPAVSTGLACATSLDEAVLKGIYELVERDAFMIVWSNRLPVPSVDIASHPRLRKLYEDRLQRDGLRYVVLRITTDIPIPSFLCLLIDEHRSPAMVCAGAATHLDPVQAAGKAMMEAVQTREWAKFLGGQRHNVHFVADFSDIREFEDHVALYAYNDMLHAVEFLLNGTNGTITDCWGSESTGSAGGDLEKTVSILAELNLETIALDLTTSDVYECGYRVARSMIPDLQPLDADHRHRFMGGRRLYEVPQRMGYRSGPTTMASLNPIPHPFP
jgi:ribosomal protein S12 methylthiotransferase accessory factor